MPGTSPAPFATTITGPLVVGNRGQNVQTLQSLLNRATVPGPALAEDGVFGAKTDTAVRAFQRSRGLVPDGIAGLLTAQSLGAKFVHQPQPPTKPGPIGTVAPASTVSPAAVLVGVIAKELKQITNAIDSIFNNGFDENEVLFTRARKLLKFGLNQAVRQLVSATRGGLAADLVAFEVGSGLLLMASGLGATARELDNGGADSSNMKAILNDFTAKISRVMDVVRRTLAGQLDGGVRAGSTLIRDLLGPLSR